MPVETHIEKTILRQVTGDIDEVVAWRSAITPLGVTIFRPFTQGSLALLRQPPSPKALRRSRKHFGGQGNPGL